VEQSSSSPTELALGDTNAVGRMLGLLGDEWTLLVVQQALLGATRFAEFNTRLPISNSVLTRRLQSLTRDGLLDRRVYQTNPTRSEYLVTPRSRSLWPVLLSIWEWERHWVPEHAERFPGMRHVACDADFAPLLICRSCGEAAGDKDVVAQWGPSGSWPRSMPVASTRRRSEADQRDAAAGVGLRTCPIGDAARRGRRVITGTARRWPASLPANPSWTRPCRRRRTEPAPTPRCGWVSGAEPYRRRRSP
jgi:DNA-binding HxlR family transcriptional regulator